MVIAIGLSNHRSMAGAPPGPQGPPTAKKARQRRSPISTCLEELGKLHPNHMMGGGIPTILVG